MSPVPGRDEGVRQRPPQGGCGAVVLALLALGGGGAAAAPPRVTVVHESRVTLGVRLFLTGGGADNASITETLSGVAGQKLALGRTIAAPGGPLVVLLSLTADPDEPRERCRVRVVSDARQGLQAARLDRAVFVPPDRVTLVDLWSAAAGRPRLVLALTAHWGDAPQARALKPGEQPVDFLIETALHIDGKKHVVDERRLTGLIGSPVEFDVRHEPGDEPVGPPAPDSTPDQGVDFRLQVLPETLLGDDLELSIRVTLLTTPAPSAAPPPAAADGSVATAPDRRDALTKRRLAMGEPADVIVPLASPGAALVVTITPYF